MVITNFPPVAVREGYRNGEHFLELDNGDVETFEDLFERLARIHELEIAYDKAVQAEVEKRS